MLLIQVISYGLANLLYKNIHIQTTKRLNEIIIRNMDEKIIMKKEINEYKQQQTANDTFETNNDI